MNVLAVAAALAKGDVVDFRGRRGGGSDDPPPIPAPAPRTVTPQQNSPFHNLITSAARPDGGGIGKLSEVFARLEMAREKLPQSPHAEDALHHYASHVLNADRMKKIGRRPSSPSADAEFRQVSVDSTRDLARYHEAISNIHRGSSVVPPGGDQVRWQTAGIHKRFADYHAGVAKSLHADADDYGGEER